MATQGPLYVSRPNAMRYHRRFVNDLTCVLLFQGTPLATDIALRLRNPYNRITLVCDTLAGGWQLSVQEPTRVSERRYMSPWMYSRFDDPARAVALRTMGNSLNPHSGKWNHQLQNESASDWLIEQIKKLEPKFLRAMVFATNEIISEAAHGERA